MATTRSRVRQSSRLTAKQRLALIQGTNTTSGVVLGLGDELINFDFFKKNRIPVPNYFAAGIEVKQLKQRGVSDPTLLIELGFDALHLTDVGFCEQTIRAYGAASVVAAFLTTPADAVSLAGSPSCELLNASTNDLLSICAGSTTEAVAVLKQQPSLEGVSAVTILDAGVRERQLSALGYNVNSIHAATGASPSELRKLGFFT